MQSKWTHWLTLASAFLASSLLAQDAKSESTKVTIKSKKDALATSSMDADSSEFLSSENLAVLRGNVRIAGKGFLLRCDKATVHMGTQDFTALGNVRLTGHLQGDLLVETEEIRGNIKTKQFRIAAVNGELEPWFFFGDKSETVEKNVIELTNVSFTTCDLCKDGKHESHYRMEAEKVRHFEDGTFEAHGVKCYLGSVPVFYLPYLTSDIEGNDGPIRLTPGYTSDWGAFLLASKDWTINEDWQTELMVDYRYKLNWGFGQRLKHTEDDYVFNLLTYYAPDGYDGSDDYYGRFNTPRERYHIDLYHQDFLSDDDDWNSRLKLDYMSDLEYKRDFYDQSRQSIYNQTNSFYDLEYLTDDFSFSFNAAAKLNDFESTVERLPEMRFDLPEKQLGDSQFTWSSYNSVANLRTRWRDFDEPLPTTPGGIINNSDYESWRLDSLQVLKYQERLGWLNVIPRAAARITHYSDSSEAAISAGDLATLISANDPFVAPTSTVKNYDDLGGAQSRVAFELGYELSTKLHRTWTDTENDFWKVDGLRHVIRPYFNHNYIPHVSEDREHLYFFDEIDRLSEQQWLRLGFEQVLQTRREESTHSLLTLNTYIDYHIESASKDEGIGDFGVALKLTPFDSWSWNNHALIDLQDGKLNLFQSNLRFKILEDLKASLNYFYRDDYTSYDVQSMGSSLLDTGMSSSFAQQYTSRHLASVNLEKQITEEFAMSGGASYDIEENELYRYYVGAEKQLHCWTMGLRFEDLREDKRVWLNFTLNAFPTVRLGLKTGVGADGDTE